MSVLDDVICSNDLFGIHKGETCLTDSLGSAFPGSTYEITFSGRLELLECSYEDRSDPNATGWAALFGAMTPVFTGTRRDLDFHGWLELTPLGRAKFTDGNLVTFEPWRTPSSKENPGTKRVAKGAVWQSDASEVERESRLGGSTAWMEILTKVARKRTPKPIPFWEALIEEGRGLYGTAEAEWLEDAERRLRNVLERVDRRPMLLGYVAERVDDGLTLYTSTANAVGKHEIGLLSAWVWPCWPEIVEAVPEFDQTHVVFDAVSRNEWSRRWDLTLQQHRAQAEEGIFG
jgi:hypothetical protein